MNAGALVELLPLFGSDVALETPPLLLSVPVAPGATVVTIVKIPVAPVPSDAAVHVIVPVEPTGGVVQLHPGAVIEPKRSDDGNASVKTALDALSGPLLVTVNVYVIVAPFCVPVLPRTRSAEPERKDAPAELLPLDESPGVPETDAVFTIVPTAFDNDVTPSVNVAVALFASEAAVHVIVPVAPTAGVEQLNPAGVLIDANFNVAGSVSVIVTDVAASGP